MSDQDFEKTIENIRNNREDMNLTVVLVGKSASGKSTLAKYISENYRYETPVSCTTRPKRPEEIHGEDYFFLTDEEFDKIDFIETTEYRNWRYGIPKSEWDKSSLKVVVTNPSGLRSLIALGENIVSICIERDEKTRFIDSINRGDSIMEIALRNERDKACFQDIDKLVNYTVSNNLTVEIAVTSILECIKDYIDNIY